MFHIESLIYIHNNSPSLSSTVSVDGPTGLTALSTEDKFNISNDTFSTALLSTACKAKHTWVCVGVKIVVSANSCKTSEEMNVK